MAAPPRQPQSIPKDDPARRADPKIQPGRPSPDDGTPLPDDPAPGDDDGPYWPDNDEDIEKTRGDPVDYATPTEENVDPPIPNPDRHNDPTEPVSTTASGTTPPKDAPHLDGAISPDLVTYRSRIAVVEAWRYPGSLTQAPPFIDRSWAAYVHDDELLGLPAGPALRVPVPHSTISPAHEGVKICRKGDYVVRQNVTIADGVDPEEVVDVWPKADFEKLFIPVAHAVGPAKVRPDPLYAEVA